MIASAPRGSVARKPASLLDSGVAHACLHDTQEVGGSSPSPPTRLLRDTSNGAGLRPAGYPFGAIPGGHKCGKEHMIPPVPHARKERLIGERLRLLSPSMPSRATLERG